MFPVLYTSPAITQNGMQRGQLEKVARVIGLRSFDYFNR